jgi:hypothetical protein
MAAPTASAALRRLALGSLLLPPVGVLYQHIHLWPEHLWWIFTAVCEVELDGEAGEEGDQDKGNQQGEAETKVGSLGLVHAGNHASRCRAGARRMAQPIASGRLLPSANAYRPGRQPMGAAMVAVSAEVAAAPPSGLAAIAGATASSPAAGFAQSSPSPSSLLMSYRSRSSGVIFASATDSRYSRASAAMVKVASSCRAPTNSRIACSGTRKNSLR